MPFKRLWNPNAPRIPTVCVIVLAASPLTSIVASNAAGVKRKPPGTHKDALSSDRPCSPTPSLGNSSSFSEQLTLTRLTRWDLVPGYRIMSARQPGEATLSRRGTKLGTEAFPRETLSPSTKINTQWILARSAMFWWQQQQQQLIIIIIKMKKLEWYYARTLQAHFTYSQ